MKKFKLFLIGILLSTSFTMFAQQTVKGVVKEKATGEYLPGVSVVVKGTTRGSETDFDGNFTIEKVKTGDILVFRYLGYADKEVVISVSFNLTIELEESSEQLEEIVVVGYGTTTIRDATGSVEAITEKKFTKGNIVTPENLLSGRVAGVNITTSGAPGSGSQIRIRGGSSLNASNDPLIVVDGLPMSGTAGGSRGVLATINPNDIASFSILKDASATAIYGSRGANGVIIITTKKGRKEYSLDYDFQMGFGEIKDRINVFDGAAFRNLVAQKQPSMAGLLGTANTNWQDEIYQKSVSTQHNITARGQIFGIIPTRLSVGFAGIEGNILTSQYDRATVSLSMNPSFFDNHFKISLNYNRAFENNRFADAGQVGAALRYDPTQPVYDTTSPFGGFYQHLTRTPQGILVNNGTRNPVASLLQNNNTSNVFRQYGNLKLEYNFHFLPELTVTANAGFDKSIGEGEGNSPLNSPANYTDLFVGYDSSYTNEVLNESFDTYFTYVKTFDKLNTDIMAGYSYQSFDGSGDSTGNRRNPNDTGATSYVSTPVVLIGFLARANLTYNEKYMLTLNYRRDGTSRFGPENRWGDFGGAALAWRVSDEDFLKDNQVISDLKLRASYGINGQQDGISGDLYLDKYRFGNQGSGYLFNGVPVQSTIPSERSNLKWENTATIELGIDYGLFNNKITGSINAFQKNSTDLLADAPVADGSNFTNRVLQNVGDLQVNGVEFTVNADIIKNEDFNWNVNFNTTYLDREIKELALNQDITTGGIAGGTGNFVQLYREGFAPNSFYVFKQLYDTAGQPIEGAYADLNGDGIINTQDKYLKGNPQADFTFGFQSSIDYKNFDLAFNLRASLGNYVYNNVNSALAQYDLLLDNAVLGNIPTTVLNTNFNSTSDVIISDIYLENASFLRMDNITLGYTFDRPIKKFASNSIRLWAGMQNVFTITNYSGLDPEVFNGIDNTIYPRPRTFLIGANIKF
ncbi:MAG: SusC/RagA family TonB-linked outer membrane protein [Polaribacter sp.]|jgi:iron complex outermembrane receptor protein|uniref:SusC/RagA family TonB-linked outer membrane protein n=1 Tax=Polaribacter sp. TaxID=1920175 RepID=UPI00260EE24B|nr:SusC/RagA family TonB-linked outer membrane protein [Polaribacter sp.]MDG1195805.1 SusC/RagA family TonB-linked outer membrane protein [Polaribacter sp.]MDG1402720.1 SusC/RagA family TonB-linked outer membrane protein [Polaribacter sp.]